MDKNCKQDHSKSLLKLYFIERCPRLLEYWSKCGSSYWRVLYRWTVFSSSYFTRVADMPSRLRLRSSTSEWPTDSAILQPLYCWQAGLSSFRRQSLEQSPCTSHISTITHGFLAASLHFSLPALLFRLNYWAFCCGHSSNFVIQATLKMSLTLTMIIKIRILL